ncbi:sigma-70 family RNA polymerase sigma factor [Pseudenhygromyxa sp. WMMC2535]|uniref:sigma-70 family RNA polymerase sigma factor n=1 Tax=Pseudenhygromyxa sp. WMMC2535 TaxID=2712867 RepID=UPI0015524003|nr:sigma-70 family RNA polymerase sigma factor [Pseudenhygromyxa sp. WMMC2535]NVB41416.1 sigma-70 family RNA polymerase sigma factor [Pseudenhygromyxa sp. WMMC2535]
MTATTCDEFMDLTTPHLPRLFRIGMRLTHQPSESQDLVQEALTKAWANWDRFEQSGSLGAWLSRILVNTFISRHRHQKVVDATAARPDLMAHLYDPHRLEEAHAPEGSWHGQHFSDEVTDALASLPDHYRRVVELVDVEGLAYKEAAEALGCPVGTVMSRLHRARKQLRDQLADYAREDYGLGLGLEAAA